MLERGFPPAFFTIINHYLDILTTAFPEFRTKERVKNFYLKSLDSIKLGYFRQVEQPILYLRTIPPALLILLCQPTVLFFVSADHISEPSNSKMGEKFGVALYEFNGEAENELTFKAGDRFEVQDLVEGAEDWRWGIIDGHKGMFPAAFVEVES